MSNNPSRRRLIGFGVGALVLAACSNAESDTAAREADAAVSPPTTAPATSTSTTSTTTTSTTSTTTTTTLPPPPGFSAAFSGDILIHSEVWTQAEVYAGATGYDFTPMWADVRELISSVDLAVCHLEVPIAPPGEEPSTYPFYGAPRELVTAIAWAGYDRCSTASNHTFDRGVRAIDATLDAFDEEGLTQAGMARTPDEITPKVIDVNGIAVTHLSYTYGYNGLTPPEGQEWRSARNNAGRIIRDAETARDLGAQVVIVSMHWGTEPLSEVTGDQRRLADAITASGLVDLVVGHHSHVVQAIEQVNGVWVVFGLGNHISAHPTREFFPPSSQDGMIVTVDVEVVDGVVTVKPPVVHPTWVDMDRGYVIRDVQVALSDDDQTAESRLVYKESLQRTAEVVGPFLALAPPP